ncbi:MAG: transposase [candidate division Zixibacteria bacterium]|nr:transposase [candidate division Zixibacteria bacterium]MDH3936727.1 transposase [candidate division Zixibacteria bacterium]MDH4033761.1 transposase [candidate division Zixibacteria bacterium]
MTTSFFRHERYGDIPGVYEAIAESLKFYMEKYSALLPGYVFMPTHIHLLIVIDGKHLSAFMRDFKKYLAQHGLNIGAPGKSSIWETGYDRQAIESEIVFRTKLEYIHNNPGKAGLCVQAERWEWSSASSYLTDKRGPIPIWKDWLF